MNPYSTNTFDREFYFPEIGSFTLYPSNACKGKQIIGKAKQLPPFIVKEFETVNKMESFSDILRSGEEKDILNYIR